MARILVIEDESNVVQILDYNLRQAGHDVLAAELGREGLRLAREERPDLVLLDRCSPTLPERKSAARSRTMRQRAQLQSSC